MIGYKKLDEFIKPKKHDPKLSGIYCIKNTTNNKMYIGCSIDIHKRFQAHCKNNIEGIGRAINKYGKENFVCYVLLLCPNICFDYWEMYFIKMFNTMSPNGYNLTGGGNLRKFVSIEARNKMSKALKGKPRPQHVKDLFKGNKFGIGNKGNVDWVRTPEYRKSTSDRLAIFNPSAKIIIVDDTKFSSIKEFSKYIKIPYQSIVRYIKNGNLIEMVKTRTGLIITSWYLE